MKKFLKASITLALALAIVLNCNITAFAVEVPSVGTDMIVATPLAVYEDESIAPYSINIEQGKVVRTSWTTIATSTTGFNCNIEILSRNAAISTTHIRMLDKNGNVLWSENDAIACNDSRIFWCGSDVYTIQARTATGLTSIYCYPK